MKKTIGILLTIVMLVGMIPAGAIPAFAEDATRTAENYTDENGETKTAENCITLSSSFAVDNLTLEAGEWYLVRGSYTVNNRIENNAPSDNPAHLILGYGAVMHADMGIHNPEGKGLVIYTYKTDVPGKLTANAAGDTNADAAIGGNAAEGKKSGDLIINGGIINATGGNYGGAGIGGGFQGGGGDVVINGGTVNATGGSSVGGAGIGGGAGSEIISGEITINGGTVTATGGSYGGAGIGGGYGCMVEKITINGGTVTATGGSFGGAGIGKGFPAENGEINGTIVITGGKVTAVGGDGSAGIGGSKNYPYDPGFKVDSITITGGEITAVGSGTAAIGGGQACIDHGVTVFGDGVEILAGNSAEDCYYHNHELYLLKRAPYAQVHAVPSYTVRHLKQTADGTGYEETETETLYGYTGAYTTAAFKMYDGFIPLTFEQQIIKTDGTTAVEIRYNAVHEHTFSTEYSSNESVHWLAATCAHGDITKGMAVHTFGEGEKSGNTTAYTCTVCGYVKTETGDDTAKLLEEAQAALEKANSDLEDAMTELEALRNEITELNNKLEKADEEQAGLKKEIADKNEQLKEKQDTIDSLNAQIDAAEKEIERLKGQSGENTCSKCGKVHSSDFFGKIICFFNRIADFFNKLFK